MVKIRLFDDSSTEVQSYRGTADGREFNLLRIEEEGVCGTEILIPVGHGASIKEVYKAALDLLYRLSELIENSGESHD